MEINEMGDWLLTICWVVTIFWAVAMGYMLTIGYKPWNRRKKNVALAIVFGWIVISCVTMIIVFWLSSRQNSEGHKKTEPKQQAEALSLIHIPSPRD